MASTSIPITVAPRIGALLRMLASPADGEALNAARALGRTLGGVGLDLNDLAEIVERPPVAPLVILRDTPASPQPRRTRKPRTSSPGGVDLTPIRRRQVVDALSKASARGALSSWEKDFCSSVIRTLQGSRPCLSARQYQVVERLLTKFGEHQAWA